MLRNVILTRYVVGNKVKWQISKWVLQENKGRPIFPKNKLFSPTDNHTCLCVSGSKKYSFFGKLGVLDFLLRPVLRFALLPYCRPCLVRLTPYQK